ncbi:DUF5610 domain-containing protein [Pseudomonas sp. Marseille-Q8238]
MNKLTNLFPVLSRPLSATIASNTRNTDAQATLANRLTDRLGLQPGALSGTNNDFTPDKVADRLMGFIEQRLQREQAAGADTSKLEKLLNQAKEGVEKGFAEARKILDGMGVLKGKVAEDINTTYDKIQSGLKSLQNSLSGTPVSASGGALAASSTRLVAQAETFDMQITTRDGDRLSVSIAKASADWSKSSAALASDGSGTVAVSQSESGSIRIGAWQVQVDGELDEDEITALKKLFTQVQDISDKFYAGDLSGAFDRALKLDMDGSQLASLSLRLTQSSVHQATDTYQAVAQEGTAVNGALLDYAQSLLDALRSTSSLADNAKDVLQQLLQGGFSLDERFDASKLDKAKTLNERLLSGLQGLVAPQAIDSAKV